MVQPPATNLLGGLFDGPGQEFSHTDATEVPKSRVWGVHHSIQDGVQKGYCVGTLVLRVPCEPVDHLEHQRPKQLLRNLAERERENTYSFIFPQVFSYSTQPIQWVPICITFLMHMIRYNKWDTQVVGLNIILKGIYDINRDPLCYMLYIMNVYKNYHCHHRKNGYFL